MIYQLLTDQDGQLMIELINVANFGYNIERLVALTGNIESG